VDAAAYLNRFGLIRVQEIEIAQCNGDIRWQTSLVHAIQSASPLPAPPDPKVFSHTLTFEFTVTRGTGQKQRLFLETGTPICQRSVLG
jgi:hypothetical protein